MEIFKRRRYLDVISLVGGTTSRPPAISWVALSSSWLTILKKRRSSRTFLQWLQIVTWLTGVPQILQRLPI